MLARLKEVKITCIRYVEIERVVAPFERPHQHILRVVVICLIQLMLLLAMHLKSDI